MEHTVYLALGGNLGDRRENLQTALNHLRAGGHIEVRQVARLYETEPVGYADQPRFLNTALVAETDLEPLALLDYLKEVEAALGRQPNFRNGPRPIDLDIVFYDELTLDEEQLQLPHPRLRGRGFVLAPLAELAPAYIHPRLKLAVAQLLAEINLAEAGVRLAETEKPLEVPPPCFLFVTGRLAEGWLNDYLAPLAVRLGFEYAVAKLEIDVAAFMTCRYIADKLILSQAEIQQTSRLIVPGFAGGELAGVEAATGIKTLRGPTDLTELESFLAGLLFRPAVAEPTSSHYTEEQLRQMQSRLTDPNIRIFSDGERIFAFNNVVFGCAYPTERDLRGLFRLLKVDNAAHAFYLGREFYKATVCIRLGQPYHQDREIELDEGCQ